MLVHCKVDDWTSYCLCVRSSFIILELCILLQNE